MTLTKRLMSINKSPRRIDRKAGGRNKKIIIKYFFIMDILIETAFLFYKNSIHV